MVHTLEEIRTRTPVNPSEAALEATMPQAAWEALLRDAFQDLRPPLHPPNPPPVAHDHPPPGVGHRRPTGPPPTPPPPDREGKGHGQGEGKGQKGTLWQGGKEGPKMTGRRPQGQGTGSDTTREQETTHGPGSGRNRDCGA